MQIKVDQISKRFLYDWIIRDFSYDFASDSITGIKGINGSGKSTLIKMLSGFLSPSEGSISYITDGSSIDRSDLYQYVSMAAPYTDIISEYDIYEVFDFHVKFKTMRIGMTADDFAEIVRLKGNKGKQTQFYSSGMRQRLQLALCVLTDSKILLLDEPTSYLDQENRDWFYKLLADHHSDRTIIIASNDDADFSLCGDVISL